MSTVYVGQTWSGEFHVFDREDAATIWMEDDLARRMWRCALDDTTEMVIVPPTETKLELKIEPPLLMTRTSLPYTITTVNSDT